MDKDRWTPRDTQSTGNNEEDVFDLFDDMQEEAPFASKQPAENRKYARNDNKETGSEEDAQEQNWLFSESEMKESEIVEDSTESAEQTEPESFVLETAVNVPVPPEPETVWEPTPMDDILTEAPGEDPEDPEEDSEDGDGIKKLVKTLVIIGVSTLAVLCIAVVGFYYFLQSDSKNMQADKEESSSVPIAYDGQELYGVIQSLDVDAGTVTVYTAETGEEKTFDLKNAESITDQYGSDMNITSLHRGQVVNVQYNAANQDAVSLFRLTSKVTELKDVYGAIVNGDILTVSGASYSMDENLICLYQGQDYDIHSLSMQQVFTAKILDGHIYTVYVSYSTGELKLQNYEEYLGGQLTVASVAGGKSASTEITENMDTLQVLEGMNTVTITMDSATVYSGKVFVVGGEVYELKLPESSERIGKVTLVANPSFASISIDGVTYAAGETIELTYGQHKLAAYADGYSVYEKTITVGQPYQRLLINMISNVTMVSITSALEGSVVYIDGHYYGTAPVRVEMTPGTYTVTLVTEGYKEVSMNVTITEGKLEQVLYFSDFVVDEPVQEEPEESSEPESSTSDSSSSVPESSSEPEESTSQPEESSSIPESSSQPEESSSVSENSSQPGESSVPESSSIPESTEPESSVLDDDISGVV